MSKTILVFGDYDMNYPRTWTLLHAFEALGFKLIHLNLEGRSGFPKYRTIYKQWKQLEPFDAVLVPFQGFTLFPIARLLTRKPIIYDALISMYDTDVHDRQYYKKWSLGGLYAYFLDWLPCKTADLLLSDTQACREYFIKTFHCNPQKIHRLWTGTNRDRFKPLNEGKEKSHSSEKKFIVGFQGKVVDRVTGLEHIVEAMHLLKDDPTVELWIIGPEERMMKIKTLIKEKRLKNIIFKGWLSESALSDALNRCDLLLSSFGNTEKLKRTIPLKVFDALALKKPIIVGDTPGARELLQDGIHCIFATLGNPESIAEKIRWAKENQEQCEKIAQNGYNLYKKELSIETIAQDLKSTFKHTLCSIMP